MRILTLILQQRCQAHAHHQPMGYATTRSRRINTEPTINNKGIQPHIKQDLTNNNWLNEVIKRRMK